MIEIPIQLKDENFRFCLLGNKSKIPFEPNWQNQGYKYDDEKLLNHLKNDGNYGVICGYGGLVVIDVDDKEEADKLVNEFDTFCVRTGSGIGIHIYIKSDYLVNHVFKDGKGELRGHNYQVVGPNCVNQQGGSYKIINETDIKFIDKNTLLKTTNYLIVKSKDINYKEQIVVSKEDIEQKIFPKLNDFTKTLITRNPKEYLPTFYGFPSRSERDYKVILTLLLKGFGSYIKSIFDTFPIGDKYKEHTAPDKYLEHTIKSARETSGVSEDLAIALEEEILSLSDRVLKNKLDFYLKQIIEIEKWSDLKYLTGLIAYKIKISKKDLEKRAEALLEEKVDTQHFYSLDEILSLDIPETTFFIKDLIPKNSLIIIQGKPGQFKSLFSLLICLSMISKQPFLDKYVVEEVPRIIYYDLENELLEIKKRVVYGLNGLNLKGNTVAKNLHFETHFKKLQKSKEIEKCKDFDIIVLDSYRRFLEGDESKSEITNKFFIEFLKPLLDLGKTVMLVAHEKKGDYENVNYEGGRMEMIRGSGDIGAQADLCLGIVRSSERRLLGSGNKVLDLSLSIEKNRKCLDIEDFTFSAEKDDTLKRTTLLFIKEGKPPKPKDRAKTMIIEFLNNKKSAKRDDITEYLTKLSNYSDRTIHNLLKELIEEQEIFQPTYGQYSLTEKETL